MGFWMIPGFITLILVVLTLVYIFDDDDSLISALAAPFLIAVSIVVFLLSWLIYAIALCI